MMPVTQRCCLALLVTWVLIAARAGAQTLLVDPHAEFAQALLDFDQAQEAQARQPDRARRLFHSAARRFENIAATGVVNGRLEYNLGNCHLQLGDIGRAILHYRRAERLIPNDPWLADNLRLARSRCLTAIQHTRRSRLLRAIFFLHYDLSLHDRARIALAAYAVVWGLLILHNFVRRRWVATAASFGAVAVIALGVSVAITHWSDRNTPVGVVTAMDVIAHKGPGTGYQRQFEQPLQPGVEFDVRGRRGGWWRIELPDGKSGWIEATGAELVSGKRD